MKYVVIAFVILYMVPMCPFAEDLPAIPAAKAVRPVGDAPISLEAMDIRIVIDDETASVSDAYYLVNTGAADTVSVGFTRKNERELLDFKAFADTELEVDSSPGMPVSGSGDSREPWWKVFRVPFPEDSEVVEVVNLYDVSMESIGPLKAGDNSFTYVIDPARYWRNSVRDARVTVFLNGIDFERVTHISPEGYARDNNRLMWHFTDFEPSAKDNIVISFLSAEVYYTLTTAKAMLEREPENAHAHYLIGQVFLLRACMSEDGGGHLEEAEPALLKAVEYNPGHLDARFCLALLHAKRGNTDAARRQLEKIVEADSSYTCTKARFGRDVARFSPAPTAAGWLSQLRK